MPAPKPISKTEQHARQARVEEIARLVGFVGRVEYRHVYSAAGGAQYGEATSAAKDLLIVFAEAFDRDSAKDDFSLAAIIAHERGHQLLVRNVRLVRNLPPTWSLQSEEIVASLIASLLVQDEKDQQDLLLKAMFETDRLGMKSEDAVEMLVELRALLEKIL